MEATTPYDQTKEGGLVGLSVSSNLGMHQNNPKMTQHVSKVQLLVYSIARDYQGLALSP